MSQLNRSYARLEYPDAPELLERLSAALHDIYQSESRRQFGPGELRHPDDYEALAEPTKDFDRALAIFIMDELVPPNQVKEALDELDADKGK